MKKVPKSLVLTFFTTWMITFVGCKKDAENPPATTPATTSPIIATTTVSQITPTTAVAGGTVTSSGGVNVTARGVCWSTTENPTTVNNKTIDGDGTGVFSSTMSGLDPSTTYFVRAYAINSAGVAYGMQYSFVTSTGPGSSGIQKADFPGAAIYGEASFSIGTKGYVGIGSDNADNPIREFWQWDQTANIWTRKADFPGSLEGRFVCFSIGTKGYVETGSVDYFTINRIIPNEFWEYDPATNTWTQKATIPVTPGRNDDVGFSIGTKGYIGIGNKAEGQNNSYYSDFWEWDQETNVWIQIADFPGKIRGAAVGFSIGNKGYIGTGSNGTTLFKEFWEWDQSTNVWTKKADFGGDLRSGAVGFSIGNRGYIGLGYFNIVSTPKIYKDIWEWDQATDVWTQKPYFRGIARSGAVGFSIGNKGYIGMGWDSTSNFKDFWEYDPTLK